MQHLLVRDIRCFRDEQRIPIRPLTLLVGENSTGKSTMLGLVRLAWDLAVGGDDGGLGLNEEPFLFGAYADMAHYHGGQGKRARSISVGLELGNGRDARSGSKELLFVAAELIDRKGEPFVAHMHVQFAEIEIDLLAEPPRADVKVDGQEWSVGPQFLPPLSLRGALLRFPFWLRASGHYREGSDASWDRLIGAARSHAWALGRPYAVAPIRTRPHRTYDPIHYQPDPEGGHVPVLLSRVLEQGGEVAERLRTALVAYGRASGMFHDVKVRRLGGRRDSDPFQVHVAVAGQKGHRNLLDVGYGVSQVLPLLVDLALAPSRVFLIQQPEVHLHPRAQAELGTLLLSQALQERRILVETHSDYLVDRVCTDVREKKGGARPEDVVILYFERDDAAVRVHPIHVDGGGNLVGAPPGYRRFFLEEQRRFLGA